MNDDDKTMLALAALAYRGFGMHSEAAIDAALRPWLPKLEKEGLGKWECVWGPASFRAKASVVDDAMVYVAKQTDRPAGAPPRYAVAIRGTNPISLFDWAFGDFWVSLQEDWAPAEGSPAKVSASTAIGLAILKHLAAETPPSHDGGRFADLVDAMSKAADHVAASLPELEPKHLLSEPETFSEGDLTSRINAALQAVRDKLHSGRIGALVDHPTEDIQQRAFDNVIRAIENTKDRGLKLRDFLDTVAHNAIVSVTGHSKGGALCAVTALWLEEEWVPVHPAEIECFSFAGPTPGNAAFAARYNASRLAGKTRRIVNPRDVVPNVFATADLQGLRAVYPGLGFAIDQVVDSIARLEYTHVGADVVKISSKNTGRILPFELIHQHLDAYLIDAAFRGGEWTARSIFLED